MISLFIDTSNSDVVIGLLENGRLIEKETRSILNEHSKYAVSIIDEVLKKANISTYSVGEILVVNGPGSFTGIRIGLTISKVYAYLTNIKVILMSSLKCLALSKDKDNYDYILSIIDAKRGNCYIGLYDKDYNEVITEHFTNMDEVRDIRNKYKNILVVSNTDMEGISKIDRIDVEKIYNYYKDKDKVNPNMVLPNYLKLPQVLEKHD